MTSKVKRIIPFLCLTTILPLAGCGENKEDKPNVPIEIKGDYNIASVYSTRKISQNITSISNANLLNKEINVKMMKNEYESAQLLLTPKNNVTFEVKINELTSKTGSKFPVKNIEVYIQQYVRILANYHNGGDFVAGDYIPDMLMPYNKAVEYGMNKCDSYKNQGITFDFNSDGVLPGEYSGNFELIIGGKSELIPVTVKVWDIEFSGKSPFKSCFLIYNNELNNTEYDASLEMAQKYEDLLLKYKFNPYLARNQEFLKVDTFIEESKRLFDNKNCSALVLPYDFTSNYTLDVSSLPVDYIVALAKECTDEKFYLDYAYFYPGPFDEADIVAERQGPAENFFKENGPYQLVLNEAISRLTNSGYFKTVSSEFGQRVKDAILKIPAVFTNVSYQSNWVSSLKNATFCPYMSAYSDVAARQHLLDAKEDFNNSQEVWAYTCCGPYYPYPSFHLDDNLLSARINGWMNQSYGIDGFLYWCVNFNTYNGVEEVVVDPYGDPERTPKSNGDGYLMYPGKKYGVDGPIPSIRLISHRDAMDDYEMIEALKNILKEYESKYEISNLDCDRYIQDLYNQIFSNSAIPSEDHKLFFEVREKLANRILELKNADGLFVSTEFANGTVKHNIYSNLEDISIDGTTYRGEISGSGYKVTINALSTSKDYKIQIGSNVYTKHLSGCVALTNLSSSLEGIDFGETETYGITTPTGAKITLKSKDLGDDNLTEMFKLPVSLKVNNLNNVKNVYFSYTSEYEKELNSSIYAQTTRKTSLFRNYATYGKTRQVCIDVSSYKIEDASKIIMQFDNVFFNKAKNRYELYEDRVFTLHDFYIEMN